MNASDREFANLVIRASAGTGKTFQLSNRFIGLAAAGEPYDTILATTFTRKGAGEILDRLLRRLAEAALDPHNQAELAAHLGNATLDQSHCLALLGNLLGQLHRLRVGTLDSFFIQIARSFSLELELPPGWQILDEIADRSLRAEAVRLLLREETTADAVRLVNLLTKGEAARSVSQQIGSLVDALYSVYLEAPPEAWRSLPRHKQLPPAELAAALEVLAAVELPDGKTFPKAREQDLANARREDWATFVSKGIAAKMIQGEATFSRKPIPTEVLDAYRPLVRHAKAVLLGNIANQTEATARLLDRFDAVYRRLKTARRVMRFEDITQLLGQAGLTDRMEEVGYRLDARVSHLLLDEFQDTNPLQWRVLRPFARRAAGAGRHSFFCVGDVKQAIFAWRGGVAEIFDTLEDDLPQLEARPLDKSYRSSQIVIDTVNRVFENIADNPALRKDSTAANRWADRFREHTTEYTEMPGYCRLAVAPRAGEGEDQGVRTLEFAADEIAQLHEQIPHRTIGVLTRRNVAVARLIYLLRHRGIEASEEGGNPLGDSPAVQLLLSLLRLADHPGDTTARFHVAHSPLADVLGTGRFDDPKAAARLAHSIRDRLMTDGYGPTLYGWGKALSPSCDRRDLGRLVQLVELAYAYEPAATTRTDDFVNLVAAKKVEDPSSAKVRVMTLHQAKGLQFDTVVLPELDARLTGQPPPVVVGRPHPAAEMRHVCRYVSTAEQALLPKQFARMFEEYRCQVVEESLCVLYVALTRAVHALHMIIAPSAANERTLPGTSAGLLRAALAERAAAVPDAVLYEHGDAEWFRAVAAAGRPAAPAKEPEPLVLKLVAAPDRPTRGLERRSPSQLEGGARVSLADRLRPDTAMALDRGTVIHAWFEQIGWLEDGLPDDQALLHLATGLVGTGLDTPALIGQFRQMLTRPAIAALLSRATYERSTGRLADSAVHASSQSHPRWEVFREQSFAIRDEDAILSGQIDRLVVLYDDGKPVGADVIDFKTDEVPGDDSRAVEARVEHYRPQLAAYRRAVAEMFGLEPERISARLAFVQPGVVRAV